MHPSFVSKRKEVALSCCTPAGARTLDTLIKSQVLYQLSYGCIALFLRFAGAKVRIFFEVTKLFALFLEKSFAPSDKLFENGSLLVYNVYSFARIGCGLSV